MPIASPTRETHADPRKRLRLVRGGSESERALPPVDLRTAALDADRSRSETVRIDETSQALRLWEGLIAGQWTLLDWFDAEGRRIIIAKRNPKRSKVSRGLTLREREVALFAALGESSKAIGYELGISPSRVSALLKAAMVKLGVRTRAQLVIMVRALRCSAGAASLAAPMAESNV